MENVYIMQHACLEAQTDKILLGLQFHYYSNAMKVAQKLQMHLRVKCLWGLFKGSIKVSALNIIHVT
jgi:hypothetical protein